MAVASTDRSRAAPPVRKPGADFRLARLYALATPLLVLPLGGLLVGASDLLFVPAVLVLARRPKDFVSNPALPYVLFVLVLAVSSSLASVSSLVRSVRLFAIFIPFLVVAGADLTRSERDRLVTLCFGSGLFAVAYGLASFWVDSLPVVEGGQSLFVGSGSGNVARAAGMIGNTGAFGHLAATWVVLCLVLVPSSLRYSVAAQLTGVFVGGAAVVLSSSRSAVVHLAVAIAVWAVYSAVRRASEAPSMARERPITVALLGTSLLLISGILSPVLRIPFVAASLRRLNPIGIGSRDSEFLRSEKRSENWTAMFEALPGQPPLGHGLRTFDFYVDNSMLTVATSAGLLGLALFLAFWGGLVVRGIRMARSIGVGLICLTTGQLAHAFAADTLTLWYSMPFAFVALGLAVNPMGRYPLDTSR